MKSPFTNALRLEPHFSKNFATVLAIAYGGAWGLLFPIALPLFLKCIIAIALFINLTYTIYRHLLYSNHPLYGAVLHQSALWLTNHQQAYIEPHSYCHPLCVILKARLEHHSLCPLVIFADALDKETFRRLRVRLRRRQ